MIGTLLIAIPGYGIAALLTVASFGALRTWWRSTPHTTECRESFGAIVAGASLAMAFAFVTNWLLGGAL